MVLEEVSVWCLGNRGVELTVENASGCKFFRDGLVVISRGHRRRRKEGYL